MNHGQSTADMAADAFIARWQSNEGGAERANYALFLTELCTLIGVDPPDPAQSAHEHNDYVFERAVTFREAGDKVGHGRIDLHKRGCFVLEAKQSRQKGGKKAIAGQDDLFTAEEARPRGRRGAERAWDVLMMNARRQAVRLVQPKRCDPNVGDWTLDQRDIRHSRQPDVAGVLCGTRDLRPRVETLHYHSSSRWPNFQGARRTSAHRTILVASSPRRDKVNTTPSISGILNIVP